MSLGILLAAGETLTNSDFEKARVMIQGNTAMAQYSDLHYNALKLLNAEMDSAEFMERYSETGSAPLYAALKNMSDGGSCEETIRQLQKAAKQMELTVYSGLCKTLIACLKRNQTWPWPHPLPNSGE